MFQQFQNFSWTSNFWFWLHSAFCETKLNRPHLNTHILIVHEDNKPHKCCICDTRCRDERSLNMQIHVASVHEGKKPLKFNLCDKSFSVKSALKTHISLVHENIHVQCNICLVQYKSNQSLKRHMSTVHGKNSSSHGLQTHFRSVHERRK